MNKLTILLSDRTMRRASELAQEQGCTPEHVCAIELANAFDGDAGAFPVAGVWAPGPHQPVSGAPGFSVADHFANYPRVSVNLAQRVVNEAMKLADVRAFKRGRGIGFRPRFAQIDYLISFRGTPGIVVSLYGRLETFDDPRGLLQADRKSYSRARILEPDQLEYFLPFLRTAYERRYGKIEESSG